MALVTPGVAALIVLTLGLALWMRLRPLPRRQGAAVAALALITALASLASLLGVRTGFDLPASALLLPSMLPLAASGLALRQAPSGSAWRAPLLGAGLVLAGAPAGAAPIPLVGVLLGLAAATPLHPRAVRHGLAAAAALGIAALLAALPGEAARPTLAVLFALPAVFLAVASLPPSEAAAVPFAGWLALLRLAPAMPAEDAWRLGLLLVLAGGILACAGAADALRHDLDRRAPARLTRPFAGLATLALGEWLLGRAVDLPLLAAAALNAALLSAWVLALARLLLQAACAAVAREAGSLEPVHLGGLIRGMPLAALTASAALGSVAFLPGLPGFAALWSAWQVLIAALRVGSSLSALLLLAAGLLIGPAAAFMAGAALRAFVPVFLGRPRTPRVAAAQEGPPRAALLAPLATLGFIGLFPAAILRLDGAAVRSLAGVAAPTLLQTPNRLLETWPLLTAAVALLAFLGWRMAHPAGAERRRLAWEDGFASPPPWLPFGDPATQIGGATLAATLLGRLPALARSAVRLAATRLAMARPPV